MKLAFLVLLPALLLTPGLSARAQTAAPPGPAASALTRQYLAARGSTVGLYNGGEYVDYTSPQIKGNPYFGGEELAPGQVHYDGFSYAGVPLQYDAHLDAVIARSADGPMRFRLVSELVAEFSLPGHRFVRLPADTTGMAAGFYEVLLDRPGQVQVLARRYKDLLEAPQYGVVQINGRSVQLREFVVKDRYYLALPGGYRAVGTKASVLAALPAHRKELSRYARAQRLRFGEAHREQAIVALAAHYAELTQAGAAARP